MTKGLLDTGSRIFSHKKEQRGVKKAQSLNHFPVGSQGHKKTRTRNAHEERSMTKGTLMKISLVIKVYERQEQQRKTKQKNKNKNRDDRDDKRFCKMISRMV